MYRRLIDPAELLGLPEKVEEFLHHCAAGCLAFNRQGTLLAAGCESGEVVLWDYETRSVARVLPSQGPSSVSALAWSSSGRRLVAGSAGGQLTVWDLPACEPRASASLGTAITLLSGLSQLHDRLLVSYQTGPAQLVSLAALAPGAAAPGTPAAAAAGPAAVQRQDLPAVKIDGDGRSSGSGSSVVLGAAAVRQDAQVAILSRCGRLIFAATKGTLLVLRLGDLAILDVVKVRAEQGMAAGQEMPAAGSLENALR